MPARAWGVEHLSELERAQKIIDAGCDQFGGESRPELVVELVRSGRVSEARIDAVGAPAAAGEVRARTVRPARSSTSTTRWRPSAAPTSWPRARPRSGPRSSGSPPPTPARRRCRWPPSRRSTSRTSAPAAAARLGTAGRRPGRRRPGRAAAQRALRTAPGRVRVVLPRRLAGVPRGGARPDRRDLPAGADDRRALPGPAGHRAGDRRRRGRTAGRVRRQRRRRRRRPARPGPGPGAAAVRPAVVHGGRRGQPQRRPVRHRRPAVPVRRRDRPTTTSRR